MMAFMLLALVTALPRLLGTPGPSCGRTPPAWPTRGGPGDSSTSPPTCSRCWGWCCPCWRGLLILGRIGLRWFRGTRALEPGVGRQAGRGRRAHRRRRHRSLLGVVAASRAPTGRSARTRRGCSPPCCPAAQHERRRRRTRGPRAAAGRGALPAARPPSAGWPSGDPAAGDLPEGRAPLRASAEPAAGDGARPERRDAPARATDEPTAPTHGPDEPWVFPFDKPLPPAEGDNQAAAVQHHRRLGDLRRRLRPGVGRRATRCSTSTRPTPTRRARTA